VTVGVRTDPRVESLLRDLAPQVLGVLVRRYGDFAACEDATQEALLAAATQWPAEGVPEQPRGWLLTVAGRRLTDSWRSEGARRRREAEAVALEPVPAPDAPAATDDTLTLLLLCCHPALSPPAQIALTLRAVGGLSTAQIAAAFLVSEDTMARRITRAKQRITAAGREFRLPGAEDNAEERDSRLAAVLHVLYLTFNEGYAASSGPALQRVELTREAIRLTRVLHRLLPRDGEVTGLLALMLLTDARRAARVGPDGALIPLAEQDRTRWDRAGIAVGVQLVTASLSAHPPGPYQIQAAIAAVHAEATDVRATDWPQILGLYRVLTTLDPSPVVLLNQAVALAMVEGPRAGLAQLDRLAADGQLAGHHRLDAVRAHLLEMAGEPVAARAAYELAARRTTSLPERRYLSGRAARLPGS